MNCGFIVRHEIAEQYLLGTLSGPERDEYERHFFGCTRCARELEQLNLLQETLETSPPEPVRVRSSPAWNRNGRWAVTIALAASLAGVALVLRHIDVREPRLPASEVATEPSIAPSAAVDSTASQPSVVEEPVEPLIPEAEGVAKHPTADRSRWIADALRRLASVSPPSYRPTVLRGATDEATALFREGMRAYVAGDYRAAVTELQRAAAEDPERPDIPYFLGISQLMVGDIGRAIDELRRTVALGESPFLGDAHFYLAKAHLARGEVAAARSELEAAAAMEGDRQSEAVTLLAELNDLDLR